MPDRVRSHWSPTPRLARLPADWPPPPKRPGGAAALRIPTRRLADADVCRPAGPAIFPVKIGGCDHGFWAVDLHTLNMAVERGELTADQAAETITARVSEADLLRLERMANSFSRRQAEYVLGALGALASSIDRHHQLSGDVDTQGGSLGRVPGLEDALITFGMCTGRAARDDARTAWGMDPPWSWTGLPGERRFGRAVRAAEEALGGVADMLAAVCAGQIAFADAEPVLIAAAQAVVAYTKIQSEMATQPLPGDFLAMRNFLRPIKIGGVKLEGPNATYAPGWNRFDRAVGIHAENFPEILGQRVAHMSPEERDLIAKECALPSIAEIVGVIIGFTANEFRRAAVEDVTERMIAAPEMLHPSLAAAASLARATAMLAGVHWGVIRANLIDPVSKMDAEQKKRLGVDPTGGVSGAALEKTDALMKARLDHPLARVKFKGRSVK